jgi:hypothetical protein
VIGFVVLLALVGWHPTPKRGDPPLSPQAAQQAMPAR